MEHIVTFSVSLDDSRIEEMVLKNAVKEITKELANRVEKIIYKKDPWEGTRLSDAVCNEIEEFMEANKDDIIERVACKLSDAMKRTKAVKEKTGKILDEV